MSAVSPNHPWWQEAVVYEVYPRSFADSDGDGIGDLTGVRSRLPYLSELGVDAIWMTPFYPSPLADGGYDVSDYRGVDPRLGTLAGFDELVAAAAEYGIRVIVDLVPNHCSAEHPAFRTALAAPAGSPEREMFIFRDGRGASGEEPPNNWQSVFHGAAWTQVTEPDGQARPVVPAPVRPGPARLELAQPGGQQLLRGGHPVLARPPRRRAAHRRRTRAVQGSRPGRPHRDARAARPIPLLPPGRTAGAVSPVAGHARLLCAREVSRPAHRGRGSLVRLPRDAAALPGRERAPPGLQLPARHGPVGRGRDAGRDRRDRGNRGRRPRAVGHRQPRRAPPGQPVRGRRGGRPEQVRRAPPGGRPRTAGRRAAGAGGGAADARAARVRLHLPGRGTGPAGSGRAARRGAPGSRVPAVRRHGPRPGRLPGTPAVDIHRLLVRILHRRPGRAGSRRPGCPSRVTGASTASRSRSATEGRS